MCDSNLPITEHSTHLGITRSNLQTPDLVAETRMRQARRTSHALMSVGLHGQNGLSGTACIHITLIPRLLYGLEAITLSVGQIAELEAFHTGML